jgi:hypothetical protein
LSVATDAVNEQHIEFQAKDVYKQPCTVPIAEESAKIKVGVLLVKAGKKAILRDAPHILEDTKREFGGKAEFIYEDIWTPRDPSTIDD